MTLTASMECKIYKGKRKQDHYLFLPVEKKLVDIPESILNMLGTMELVMQLNITKDMVLAQSDPEQVLNVITEKGFYIQIPPKDALKI